MNGDQKEFIKKLDEQIRDYDKRIALQEQINKQQQTKYAEMLKDIGKIFGKIDQVFERINTLPCDVQRERFLQVAETVSKNKKDLDANIAKNKQELDADIIWNRRVYIGGVVLILIVGLISTLWGI